MRKTPVIPKRGFGRHVDHDESGRREASTSFDVYDGGAIEDYEDSTRANRPSDSGAIPLSQEIISRFSQILIVKLRRRGISYRDLGRILNRSAGWVHKAFNEIPEDVRKHYEAIELG